MASSWRWSPTNCGPGYAQRYARGQAVLYGETRDYVKRVLERVNGLR